MDGSEEEAPAAAGVTGADEGADEHEGHPRGTMVLMLGFLVLIALMWAWAYYSLIARG